MKEMKNVFRAAALLLALLLTGCTAAVQEQAATSSPTVSPAATAAQPATSAATDTDAAPTAGTVTMANVEFDTKYDYTDWKDGAYTSVTLSGTSITADGAGAQIDGNVLTITAAGTYVLSGSLTDGVILVDASDDAQVRIVLNGANIACSNGAPLFVKNADLVILSLAPDTENSLADAAEYNYAYYDKDDEEPSAALFCKTDLVINGTGALTVTAQNNDGIATNDSLRIVEGTINVTAKDDGIVGKDMVGILSAQLTITSGGDGVKSTNDKDEGMGFIAIANGNFVIKAGADGLQAETELYIQDGSFDITTGSGSASAVHQTEAGGFGGNRPQDGAQGGTLPGGGTPPDGSTRPGRGQVDGESSATVTDNASATTSSEITIIQTAAQDTTAEETSSESAADSYKALKASSFLTITGGSFTIDSQDDAVHSNTGVAITGGSLSISVGDDGIHADDSVYIGNGLIRIATCYEGVEGMRIDIAGGEIDIIASDDGINVAGGNDQSSGGQDMFAELDGARFIISGGTINVNADGDGLDTNGSGYITGGTVTVTGPTSNGNGALDYNGEFEISGGTLIAVGSSGMAQAPSDGTTQLSIAGNLDTAQEAGSTLTLTDSSGKVLLSFTPDKAYQFVAFSSADLKSGETYGINVDGVSVQTVTMSDTVTTFSLSGGMGGMGGGRMGGGQQPGKGQQPAAGEQPAAQASDAA